MWFFDLQPPFLSKFANFSIISPRFSDPMKSSLRPLMSILLLIGIAATLTFRIAVRRGGFSAMESAAMVRVPAPPAFNSTLLEFAAIDLGEPRFKEEMEQFLEGSFRRQRRHRSINTLQGHLRSPKYYRFWLESRNVLQDWSRRKRFQPEIMSELARLVRPRIDRRSGSERSSGRYSSCAVVGNSGILLRSDHGALIDSHEMVIRLNNAKIEGFEENVGAKTNISFVNSNILHQCASRETCFCSPYGPDVALVMYMCQAGHFLDYALCSASKNGSLIITDPRFDVLCARIVKYYSVKRFVEEMGKPLEQWSGAHEGDSFHYSSGMQAVMLALGLCNKVSLFGFGKSALAKHHYHTRQKAELSLHDYEAEYAFYRDLIDNKSQVIPFLSGKFKLPPVLMYQ